MNRVAVSFLCPDISKFNRQLLIWANNYTYSACLHSAGYSSHPYSEYDTLVAVAEQKLFFTDNSDRFEQLKKYYDQQEWLFGYLSYDLKNDIENISSAKPDTTGFPEIFFFNPDYLFEIKGNNVIISSSLSDHDKIFMSVSSVEITEEKIIRLSSKLTASTLEKKYLKNAGLIKDQIIRGDYYELNYCQQFYCTDVDVEAISLYQSLNRLSPSPFSAFLKLGQQYILCTSPERFLRKKNNRLISQPIKGTRKRNLQNREEDERLITELKTSEKERAENLMIVDLVRNDLSRSSITGTITTEELCTIYTYPQVHHMVSTISSFINPSIHPVDAIRNAFPMGSMTGAPKVEVMKAIEFYEDTKRGVYSGAIGYIRPDGDFDFNVAIRTALYNKPSHFLSYSVGGAIVYDSIPENEYQECLLKAKALRILTGDE